MRLIDADNIDYESIDSSDTSRYEYYYGTGIMAVRKEDIDAQPTIEERKTGKWINAYPDIEPNPMLMYGICSVCGFEQSISDKLKYCPNCGARLVREGEEHGQNT